MRTQVVQKNIQPLFDCLFIVAGMIKFIEKYIIHEKTPLPQLLDVFGCQLVSNVQSS